MWEIRITRQALAGLGPEVRLRVAVTINRDGKPGICLWAGSKDVGQWMDSRAFCLALNSAHQVTVLDRDSVPRYRVLLPGTTLSARQLSDTEVEVSLSLEGE